MRTPLNRANTTDSDVVRLGGLHYISKWHIENGFSSDSQMK